MTIIDSCETVCASQENMTQGEPLKIARCDGDTRGPHDRVEVHS
jgi:hypothetical protein